MQKRSEYNAHEGKKGGKPPAKIAELNRGKDFLERKLFLENASFARAWEELKDNTCVEKGM